MDANREAMSTFWQKPEGKAGKILGVLGGLVGAYFTVKYGPEIMDRVVWLLESGIRATVAGFALFLISSPIWSPRVRTVSGYMLRSVLRKITAFFVEIDPIGILKNYLEDLKKNMAVMDAQIGNLAGHIQRLRDIIAGNEAERVESLKLAGVAKKRDSNAAFILNARKAGRLEKSNMTLQGLLTKMEGLHRMLKKLQEVSGITVADMASEIQVKEVERKAILASYGAFTSALKVLRGDPNKRELFDQAMDYLAVDFAAKVGEIEDFMQTSKGFIESIDLTNGVYEADALMALEKSLEEKTNLLLAPYDPKALPEGVRLDPDMASAPPDSEMDALYAKGGKDRQKIG